MRIGIYARVSTEKQEKEETIQSQLDELRIFAQKSNYTILGEYIDNGYSGGLLDRPALDKLRDDASKKIFDAILIHSPDRLSRKYIHQELIREELKKRNVNIIFLNRPQSGDTPEDQLLNGIQGLVAEYERAKISERMRRGRLYKAKKGLLITSIAPYGYRYVPKDKIQNKEGHYEIAKEEAIVVKKIFALFVNKQMSIKSIARKLIHQGIPPRQGKYWRTSSLHRILRNETYTGVTYYNKHASVESSKPKRSTNYKRRKNTSLSLRPRDQWIAIPLPENLKIIDKKTFELAQKQLKKNSELSPRNIKYHYLLRGLLKCGNCGSAYLGMPCHGKLYYRCGNRDNVFPKKKECNASLRSAPLLEGTVWEAICRAIQSPKLIIEQVKNFQLNKDQERRKMGEELKRIEITLMKTEEEENRILDAYRGGAINMEQLKVQIGKIQEKRNVLYQEKQELSEQRTQGISSELINKNVKDYCKAIKIRLNNIAFEEKQRILRLLVNRIILEEDRVRIKGIIPLHQNKQQECHIASTITEYYDLR